MYASVRQLLGQFLVIESVNSCLSGKKNRVNSSPLPAKGVFNQKIEPQFIGSSLEVATVLFCLQQIQK